MIKKAEIAIERLQANSKNLAETFSYTNFNKMGEKRRIGLLKVIWLVIFVYLQAINCVGGDFMLKYDGVHMFLLFGLAVVMFMIAAGDKDDNSGRVNAVGVTLFLLFIAAAFVSDIAREKYYRFTPALLLAIGFISMGFSGNKTVLKRLKESFLHAFSWWFISTSFLSVLFRTYGPSTVRSGLFGSSMLAGMCAVLALANALNAVFDTEQNKLIRVVNAAILPLSAYMVWRSKETLMIFLFAITFFFALVILVLEQRKVSEIVTRETVIGALVGVVLTGVFVALTRYVRIPDFLQVVFESDADETEKIGVLKLIVNELKRGYRFSRPAKYVMYAMSVWLVVKSVARIKGNEDKSVSLFAVPALAMPLAMTSSPLIAGSAAAVFLAIYIFFMCENRSK